MTLDTRYADKCLNLNSSTLSKSAETATDIFCGAEKDGEEVEEEEEEETVPWPRKLFQDSRQEEKREAEKEEPLSKKKRTLPGRAKKPKHSLI